MFGFTAALLESLPFIGLFFTISNQVGAAMWAHGAYAALFVDLKANDGLDLEKRQHFIREQKVHEIVD